MVISEVVDFTVSKKSWDKATMPGLLSMVLSGAPAPSWDPARSTKNLVSHTLVFHPGGVAC